LASTPVAFDVSFVFRIIIIKTYLALLG